MAIPTSLLNDLIYVPRDRQVALLMRHSARFPITDPEKMFEVPLTEEGVQMAEELGKKMGELFPCGRLLASPVGRCLATANAIARGAGWPFQAAEEERISHMAFGNAWDLLNRGEVNGILPEAILTAIDLLAAPQKEIAPALDVMVSHDTVVGAFAGCLLKAPVTGAYWPGFLEGVFLWREGNGLHALWRGTDHFFSEDALPILSCKGIS